MSAKSRNRDATAVIRGYLYQFDATILSALKLPDSGQLTVEGIEDFDTASNGDVDCFQCKYYAATRLTPATLRDAILPMLEGFLALPKGSRKKRRYHLYGYFKDSTPQETSATIAELKAALVQRKQVKTPSGEVKVETVNLQDKLGASDKTLQQFARNLSIHICDEYENHKEETIRSLKSEFSVSIGEARDFLYPSALTLVSNLAVGDKPAARRIDRKSFVTSLKPSQALFCEWVLREQGETKFCRYIRQKHFSQRNIDACPRVFVIETPRGTNDSELMRLLRFIQKNWSSHLVKRKPESERYAPFVFFRSLQPDQIVSLKSELHRQGVGFVDGYPFMGAEFSYGHLNTKQTYQNQISLRFISSQLDFEAVAEEMKTTGSIYEFYQTSHTPNEAECHYLAVPVSSIEMIRHIL